MDHDEVLYYNFAPVFKGGPDIHHRYIVTKKTISTIDFLNNNTRLPNPLHQQTDGAVQYDSIPDSFRYMLESNHAKLIDNNIMEVDGVRIGLEVCLDHKKGLLYNILQNEPGDMKDKLVDVLLITSAGMAIEFGPNPIVPGGVVYMTDGGATSAACWRDSADQGPFDPQSTCRLPTPKAIKHYPSVLDPRFSSFFTVSACVDILDFSLLKGYFSLYANQGCTMTLSDFGIEVMDEFKHNLPSIEFYPIVDLPKNHGHSN
jgi:hypothetical protein